MKTILGFLALLVVLLQWATPSFASIPGGSIPPEWRPRYKEQVEYITNNSCESIGIVPYAGLVYYICPSGEIFWAEVLVPIDNSILLPTNKKHSDDSY
jgi:hypothetical protein